MLDASSFSALRRAAALAGRQRHYLPVERTGRGRNASPCINRDKSVRTAWSYFVEARGSSASGDFAYYEAACHVAGSFQKSARWFIARPAADPVSAARRPFLLAQMALQRARFDTALRSQRGSERAMIFTSFPFCMKGRTRPRRQDGSHIQAIRSVPFLPADRQWLHARLHHAMVAVALTLGIRVLRFLNFSIPGLFMISAMATQGVAQRRPWPLAAGALTGRPPGRSLTGGGYAWRSISPLRARWPFHPFRPGGIL